MQNNKNDKGNNLEKSRNNTPKKKLFSRVVLIISLVILIPIITISVYIFSRMSVMNQKIEVNASSSISPSEAPEVEEALPTNIPEINTDELSEIEKIANQTQSPDQVVANPKIVNILLLGLDTRNPKQFTGGRTDSIIILTLDTINKEIKLTSIMRDTLLSIPGHDNNRINTVYSFCGPDITMETIQKYYGIKIDYYAVVNFWAVANVIDSIGGVDISIKQAEISNMNFYLDEINKSSSDKNSPHIRSDGLQKLDGKQAAAYMRIRHIGEADFERTQRQRRVLEAIMGKNMSIGDVVKIANSLPDNVRTNAKQLDLVSLANTAFGLKGSPIKQLRLPIDGGYKFGSYKGMSILIVDFKKNSDALKKFISDK